MKSNIAVIGLGNTLLQDEGIGVHVVTMLKENYTFCPAVDVLDGGTMGLDLIPFLEGKDKVLFVDAVDFGKEPGSIGIVERNNISSIFNGKLSVHHLGLADVVSVLRLMDVQPSEICLIGVQPHSIEVGLELSEPLRGVFHSLVGATIGKLGEWNVGCRLRKIEPDYVM